MTQTGRVFRVFVSSTFSDLQAERDAIHARVFPRLRQLCHEHAARFQAVDLRWGVSDEAALDQRTLQICLGEIARCQQTTPRPNFIILLGDRYGWRPLPEMIPTAEFAAIAERLSDTSGQQLLQTWYRRDDNAVPPIYWLQPRTDEYRDYAIWEARVERPLHALLLNAISELQLPVEARLKYAASATAQEIARGVTDAQAAGHAFGFFRKIESLPSDARAGGFVDLDELGQPDIQARAQLEALKDDLRQRLRGQIYEYQAQWTGSGITTDHLSALCEAVYTNLAHSIVAELAQGSSGTPLEAEATAHRTFGDARARFFVGRDTALQTIAEYMRGSDPHPLGVWGPSGVGKSTLMAQAAALARRSHPHAVLVARFIGATPSSSDGRALLESLSRQITQAYSADETTIASDYRDLVTDFPKRLALATGDRPLIVFLDALDQLAKTDDAHRLAWLPAALAPHVRLVTSTLAGEPLAMLERLLPVNNLVALEPLASEEGRDLLNLWLRNADRTLQPEQANLILESFARNGLPLYLRLLFEESRLWHSDTEPPSPSPDIPGIIRDLFSRLAAEANHGALLVERSLGYLAAARHGLSEDEILEVLSIDAEVLRDFQRRSPKSPLVNQLPVVVWSRLYADLEHYLGERTADNRVLLSFYHRQLGEAAALFSGPRMHRHLADYFENQALYPIGDRAEVPNLRRLSELPYQLAYGGLSERLKATLSDFGFMQAKVSAVGPQLLIDDYNLAAVPAAALPAESQANLRLIQDTLQLSKHLVVSDPAQLASQLTGRLLGFREPEIQALLESIPQKMTAPWLRPLTLSLTPPDGTLRHTLVGEDGGNAIALAADGKRALSSSEGGRLTVWDLESGVQLYVLASHAQPITALALSADGRRAISGAKDGMLKVWDLEQGLEVRTVTVSTDAITALAMTPDGRRALAGSNANILTVWDLESGVAVQTLYPVGEAMLLQAQAFDKKRDEEIAAQYEEYQKMGEEYAGDVAALSVMGGAFSFLSPECRYRSLRTIRLVALSEDGRRAATVSDEGLIKVWDLEQGREEHALQVAGEVKAVMIAGEEWRAVAVADTEARKKTVSVWDVRRGTKLSDLTEFDHYQLVMAVALTADGRRAILSGKQITLAVWDLERGQEECALPGHEATTLAVTTDGRLVLSGTYDGTLKLWRVPSDVQSNPEVQPSTRARIRQGYAGRVTAVAITADESRVVFGLIGKTSGDEAIHLLDLTSGEERILGQETDVKGTDAICAMLMTADGRRAITGNSSYSASGTSLRFWDFKRGVETGAHKMGIGEMSMALTADERRLVVGSDPGHPGEGKSRYWDVKRRALIEETERHWGKHTVLKTWSPNLSVWDLERGTREQSLLDLTPIEMMHAGESKTRPIRRLSDVNAVAVTPCGRRAITGSTSGNLTVWDLERGVELHALNMGDTTQRYILREETLESIDESDLVRREQIMDEFSTHDSITALAVTPDGRRVISGSKSKIEVWDLAERRRLFVFTGHRKPIVSLLVTPDGRRAITTTDDGILRVRNLETGLEERHLDNHRAVGITADGRYVFSILGQQTLTAWDLTSGNIVARFTCESPISTWAVALSKLTVAVGAEFGRMHVLRLENLPLGPGIISAWNQPVQSTSRKWWPFSKRSEPPPEPAPIAFGCPFCRTWSDTSAAALNTELGCPHCGRPLKLNPIVIEGDWRAVAQAWDST